MKWWYLLSICIALQAADKTSGLECWKCENAKSEKDCIQKGYLQQCRYSETVCQTEVRYSVGWGKRPMIKTSCKEAHACNDNFVQNPRSAWGPTQCNGKILNSVCRCCCNETLCNRQDLMCDGGDETETTKSRDIPGGDSNPLEGFCSRPRVPNRGKVSCTNGMQLSSTCTFTCDEGYELVGQRAAVCFQFPSRPMWNRRTPTCRRKIENCRPAPTPEKGSVTCSSSSYVVGTSCTFSCDNGYILKGAPVTSCVKVSTSPQWDEETPSCVGVCESVTAPDNGEVECTGANKVDTGVCTFRCNEGYQLLGFRTTSCIDTTKGPEWTRNVPTCQGFCENVGVPENGGVDCAGANEVNNAVCVFRCNEGYELVGSGTTSCIDTNNGPDWSNDVPTCRGTCNSVSAPANGRVDCVGSNEVGTASCTFQCNDGYQLVGSRIIDCIGTTNGPQWSEEVPICQGLCDPMSAPENGRVDCTGSNEVNIAICGFSCNEGFRLNGSDTTSCISTANGPEWSNDVPTCIALCDPITAPEYGRVDCTGSNEVDKAVCVFQCNTGLDLIGFDTSSCINTFSGPDWSNDTPNCTGSCDDIFAPEYGELECAGPDGLGRTCGIVCENGLQLEGSSELTCIVTEDGPRWNDDVPTCNGTCSVVETPEQGSVDCTGSGELGTTCEFSCNEGTVMDGAATTTCEVGLGGPQWSNESPNCSALPPCPELGGLRNGQITCTDANNDVGTTCAFECTTEGYELLPSDRLSTECEAIPNGQTRWSKLKPCCNAECPPMARRDIVIVIDSSSSITNTEWAAMKSFLVDVIRTFEVSNDAVQIASFRFNRRIDTESQVLFGDYQTKEELVTAVQRIPKNGGGTFIGQALRHAQQNVLTVNNRPNVTDMVFVMTDGRSGDEFRETAKELRDSGVQIVALGIFKNQKELILPQLIEMTGHENLVIEVKDVLEGVQSDLVNLVVDKICEVSCK